MRCMIIGCEQFLYFSAFVPYIPIPLILFLLSAGRMLSGILHAESRI